MFDLFILHAADDREFVRGYLLPALNLPAQRMLLLDDLPLGAVIVSEIDRGISSSRFTVVVLSPAYLHDRWTVYGEQLAIHVSLQSVHVIPLRLVDVKLPHRLEARISLDFTDPARWDAEAARLRSLLHTTPPAVERLACPYPGMRPFTEHQARLFFGRAKEIEDLVDRLERHEREIYAIGPSGSGKSSLMHAGLLHVLNTGSSRLGHSFVVRVMRPGDRPTDRLALAFDGDLAAPEATIDRLLGRRSAAGRVLLIIDQLEELFALADAAEQRRFVAALRALGGDSRCHFLFVLRADFYGVLMESELWPARNLAPINVAPLRGPALAQAITEPAAQAGVYLERRLCDRLVADAGTEPGALPHVQETLRLLWEAPRQRLLGLAEYEALGDGGRGLDAAIARQANATMRSFTAGQQAIARRVLLRLVVFGKGRADTRRQQTVGALRSATDDDTQFSHVLQRLVEDRLITVQSGEQPDDAVVDLSHEAVITAWPAFRDWIARQRGEEQLRRRLETKVTEWIERGRGNASLLDPLELSEAEQWMQSAAAHDLGYGRELVALVAASKHEIDETRRRQHRARLQMAVMFALAAMMAIIAWIQWQGARRREAEARQPKAAKAAPLLKLPHGCVSINGIVFGPDGIRVAMSCDNTAQIWNAMTGARLFRPLQHQGAVRTLAFSPDGMRVVSASDDGTARVWDAWTGKPVTPPLQHPGAVAAAAFTPDGTRIVTTSGDGRRRWPFPSSVERPFEAVTDTAGQSDPYLSSDPDITQEWEAATGKRMTLPIEYPYALAAAAFSRDVTRVVTIGSHGKVQAWDITRSEPIPLLGYSFDVTAAAFSPDGTRLITASSYGTAQVWNVMTGKPVTPMLVHHGMVTAATFSPDGFRVVTVSNEDHARLWNITTDNPAMHWLVHDDIVTTAAFSADGTRVVTASEDSTARVWDAVTGEPVTLALEHARRVTAAALSPHGERVATASEDGMLCVWDATPITLGHEGN